MIYTDTLQYIQTDPTVSKYLIPNIDILSLIVLQIILILLPQYVINSINNVIIHLVLVGIIIYFVLYETNYRLAFITFLILASIIVVSNRKCDNKRIKSIETFTDIDNNLETKQIDESKSAKVVYNDQTEDDEYLPPNTNKNLEAFTDNKDDYSNLNDVFSNLHKAIHKLQELSRK